MQVYGVEIGHRPLDVVFGGVDCPRANRPVNEWRPKWGFPDAFHSCGRAGTAGARGSGLPEDAADLAPGARSVVRHVGSAPIGAIAIDPHFSPRSGGILNLFL